MISVHGGIYHPLMGSSEELYGCVVPSVLWGKRSGCANICVFYDGEAETNVYRRFGGGLLRSLSLANGTPVDYLRRQPDDNIERHLGRGIRVAHNISDAYVCEYLSELAVQDSHRVQTAVPLPLGCSCPSCMIFLTLTPPARYPYGCVTYVIAATRRRLSSDAYRAPTGNIVSN